MALCTVYDQAVERVRGKDTEQLIQLLWHEDVLTQCLAIERLVNKGAALAVPHLVSLTERTKSPGVREKLAWALGVIGDPQAVPTLINILQSDTHNRHARRAAAEALGKIADRQAVPALIYAVAAHRGWRDEGVPEAAAWALGVIGDPQAVPVLIQALRDSNKKICCAAAEALGKIGDSQVVPPLIEVVWAGDKAGEIAKKALLQLPPAAFKPVLSHPSAYTRMAACELLGEIGGSEVIAMLTEVVARDTSWQVRREAAASLVKIFG